MHHASKGGTVITSASQPIATVSTCVTPTRAGFFWLASTTRRADAVSLAILVVTILFGARDLMLNPVRAGLDTLSFFWPVYAFLGEQLRTGNVPGWNPYQFSGVPFAADAESGWMYLPAMVIFTLMPLAVAIKVYAVAHILIAGCGMYLYGRVIGLIPAGALVSAWAVSQGGLFSDRSRCCYAHIQVAAWIPVVLLGVELAVRTHRHRSRLLAWLLTGFAISQMLAGWIGQGAMYGLLLFAGYVLFRTVVYPATSPRAPSFRLQQLVLHGLVPLLFGLGLAAPGLLPRIAYYRESNLAGGYRGTEAWAAELGGWTFGRQLELLLHPSGWFIWPVVFALGFIAVFHTVSRQYAVFFLILTVAGFTLGLERPTILHRVAFAVLPVFEDLHSHFPERIALVFLFGPAMLAGLGMTHVIRSPNEPSLMLAAFLVALAAAGVWAANLGLPAQSWVSIAVVAVMLGVLALSARRGRTGLYRTVAVALLASVVIELQFASWTSLRNGYFTRLETTSITERNETAEIIMVGDPVVPPRFFGYDPAVSFEQHGEITYYRHAFTDGITFDLLVNNRGTLWDLADIQGYNPLQLEGYVTYIRALNGVEQEYHGSYILPPGLDSPLLSLLAPRFIVIPLEVPQDRADLQALLARYPTAATTSSVRVLRVTDSYPRAWIVHDVQVLDDDLETALSDGEIDFRRTALVEDEIAPLDAPSGSVAESATFTDYETDHLTMEVTSDGDGLLVLSEVYADGWTSTVDGGHADVVPVNGALRGVVIPDGTHTVTLAFEPPGLEAGYALGISTVILASGGVIGAAALDRRSAITCGVRHGPRGARTRPAAFPGLASRAMSGRTGVRVLPFTRTRPASEDERRG